MKESSLGELVVELRNKKGLTQEELAQRCDLDVRTIQRIEKEEVKPYFSTLKIISDILEYDFITAINSKPWQFSEKEMITYREQFKKKRSIRLAIFFIAIVLMLIVATTFPHFRLLGMAKSTWTPFFYILMFCLIICIGIIWRCPSCKTHLGDPFRTKYCPKCGIKLID
jgi:transcriptional regulator with XRE-family HTH domain